MVHECEVEKALDAGFVLGFEVVCPFDGAGEGGTGSEEERVLALVEDGVGALPVLVVGALVPYVADSGVEATKVGRGSAGVDVEREAGRDVL